MLNKRLVSILVPLCLLMVLISCTSTPDNSNGAVVYRQYCMQCHQADGAGVANLNPPLIQTEWVLGDKSRLIGVVLNGLSDPIEINGETFRNVMASHAFLSDQDIADVLTYVRSSFGNEASAVTPEEVMAERLNQTHVD
ncbi:cytochrome c [Pontibacter sp. G13]|uniref:c-type cytochrome n=1 Tax=Pontibacter sp. G13 TaxID=3074898 RepID=UPI00288C354F|nr:cytochrome c [Pontibacter sp. G13]WNJ19220.1 cytochrome c [Pontibacter sp. G13]